MHDTPKPEQLLAEVARFLRDDAGPALAAEALRPDGAALAYQARVAANMLDMVRRQTLLAPAADAAETARLRALLGPSGPHGQGQPGDDLLALNRRLAARIAAGTLTLHTPGLADHLWSTTLDKLAVDQPGYETYRRHASAPPAETP